VLKSEAKRLAGGIGDTVGLSLRDRGLLGSDMDKQMEHSNRPLSRSDVFRDRPKDELAVPAPVPVRGLEPKRSQPLERVWKFDGPDHKLSVAEILSLEPGESIRVPRNFLVMLTTENLRTIDSFCTEHCLVDQRDWDSSVTIHRPPLGTKQRSMVGESFDGGKSDSNTSSGALGRLSESQTYFDEAAKSMDYFSDYLVGNLVRYMENQRKRTLGSFRSSDSSVPDVSQLEKNWDYNQRMRSYSSNSYRTAIARS
jgi:hypothetical protein